MTIKNTEAIPKVKPTSRKPIISDSNSTNIIKRKTNALKGEELPKLDKKPESKPKLIRYQTQSQLPTPQRVLTRRQEGTEIAKSGIQIS